MIGKVGSSFNQSFDVIKAFLSHLNSIIFALARIANSDMTAFLGIAKGQWPRVVLSLSVTSVIKPQSFLRIAGISFNYAWFSGKLYLTKFWDNPCKLGLA